MDPVLSFLLCSTRLNQDSGHHLEGSHLIYPFCVAWFISSIFPFFVALVSFSFMEGKSECSCTYGSRFSRKTHKGTDQQIICTDLSENCQHEREAQATLVLGFIGQCWCEFLRFLDFFALIYKEVLTCSLRGTLAKKSVLTTVIYGKFNNRSSWKLTDSKKCLLWIISRNCWSKKSRANVVAQKYFRVKLKTPKLI